MKYRCKKTAECRGSIEATKEALVYINNGLITCKQCGSSVKTWVLDKEEDSKRG